MVLREFSEARVFSALIAYSWYACYLWSLYDPVPGTDLGLRITHLYFIRITMQGIIDHAETTYNGADHYRPDSTISRKGGPLTRGVLRSQSKPAGQSKRGAKEISTRQSHARALKAAGLLDSTSQDGVFSKWMHRFGEHDIGSHIDEQLGLEKRTYEGKSRSKTRIRDHPPPTTKRSTSFISPRSRYKG